MMPLRRQNGGGVVEFRPMSPQADDLGRLTAGLTELTSAQQRTDQQLRDVIQMFERHLREDHGRRLS